MANPASCYQAEPGGAALAVDLFPEMAAVAGLRKPDGSMDQRAFMKAVMLFSENTLDKLIEVVYNALLRAHPTLTREQFNDMPIAPMELFGALEVISAAVGLLTRTDKVAAPGEA